MCNASVDKSCTASGRTTRWFRCADGDDWEAHRWHPINGPSVIGPTARPSGVNGEPVGVPMTGERCPRGCGNDTARAPGWPRSQVGPRPHSRSRCFWLPSPQRLADSARSPGWRRRPGPCPSATPPQASPRSPLASTLRPAPRRPRRAGLPHRCRSRRDRRDRRDRRLRHPARPGPDPLAGRRPRPGPRAPPAPSRPSGRRAEAVDASTIGIGPCGGTRSALRSTAMYHGGGPEAAGGRGGSATALPWSRAIGPGRLCR